MTIPLSTLNPTKLEFKTTIKTVNEDGSIVLDETYFYATSGGQPADTGTITRGEEQFLVSDVRKQQGATVHVVDHTGLQPGDQVDCNIDEERRTRLMRMHTAIHILAAVIEQAEQTHITGGQIGVEKSRIDVNLTEYNQEKLLAYVEQANEIAQQGIPLKKYATTRDALEKNPELIKLAKGFPGHIKDVHIVEIEGFDIQPCGGTHVENTSEIGAIKFLKAKNMGKNNRRIYITIEP